MRVRGVQGGAGDFFRKKPHSPPHKKPFNRFCGEGGGGDFGEKNSPLPLQKNILQSFLGE